MDCLYIIIPAYNEEDNIEKVTREWHNIVKCSGNNSRLVIIDDGSVDSTYDRLIALEKSLSSLEVIRKKNSGHGGALLYGYKYAISKGADFVFQTDSDDQTLPEEFNEFWEIRNKYSAIIGYRNKRSDGSFRIFVSKALKLLIYFSFKLNIKDANTPYRLIKCDVLGKYIDKIPKDYNLTNVLISIFLINADEEVMFLPITFNKRSAGENFINFKRIVKIGIQAIKDFKKIKKSLWLLN